MLDMCAMRYAGNTGKCECSHKDTSNAEAKPKGIIQAPTVCHLCTVPTKTLSRRLENMLFSNKGARALQAMLD